jgi:hypothetical protein
MTILPQLIFFRIFIEPDVKIHTGRGKDKEHFPDEEHGYKAQFNFS